MLVSGVRSHGYEHAARRMRGRTCVCEVALASNTCKVKAGKNSFGGPGKIK